MSIIVTRMDMPKSCDNCPICHINWDNYAYCATGKSEPSGVKIPDGCPLKSVDGLIEEMESAVEELRKYNENLHHESHFHGTPEIHSISGQIAGLLNAIEIIKEYSEVKE